MSVLPPNTTEDRKGVSAPDPIALFQEWFREAETHEAHDPTAVALATVDPDGTPSVRMVLFKDVSPEGFMFFTNLESRKACALRTEPRAAMCIYWHKLDRQVRVEGRVKPVSDEVADAYFATRDRTSQIGAWASDQSQPLASMLELEKRFARYSIKFALRKVPRPPFWSGFRLVPETIEFWRRRPFRLHERVVYHLEGGAWRTERLCP
jgi:pyridoxamine 5'-phosphate oxidase